jgi:hypothetical protein
LKKIIISVAVQYINMGSGILNSFKKTVYILLSILTGASNAMACTEDAMLEFIGSLEAPAGYTQVYSGVKVLPPYDITSMSVREVLDWQRIASRTAVSSAAGRYQVIRATLKGLVKNGVVREGDTFNQRTQDKIGRHLLRSTGYRSGENSIVVANRVAGIWAALPQIGGIGGGGSVYEGIAGNHALVDAATYEALINCEITVAEAVSKSNAIRAGIKFGFEFDNIIQAIADATPQIIEASGKYALGLLFALFTVDLVIRFGRAAVEGSELGSLVETIIYKFLIVVFFAFVIMFAEDIIKFVANFGTKTGEDLVGKSGFSLAGYARDKIVLIFSITEESTIYPIAIRGFLFLIVIAIIVLTAFLMGVVTYSYADLFISSAAGVIVLGLGGLSATQTEATGVIFKLLGAGLRICGVMVILHLGLEMAQITRGDHNAVTTACFAICADFITLILVVSIPRSISTLARS